ncbi:hydroxyisourate hydrolase [Cryobacterium frigoriphilum]|uniref:5-hydroxyisourate hydrolase n=1 Tax=Cryobacterium frigoriphilum TaxID=1259150 RepID=A0A4R9A8Y6_9MICO|nr:hydroxyisourate hydrolase [Cryobacterium frigoriphilum]
MRSAITTHVLDAVTGRPAVGVPVELQQLSGLDWNQIGRGATDADGRLASLGPATLPPGRYRVVFDTGEYFARTATPTFYPEVVVSIELHATPGHDHVHVPLLLSPFAYSTYRGS